MKKGHTDDFGNKIEHCKKDISSLFESLNDKKMIIINKLP